METKMSKRSNFVAPLLLIVTFGILFFFLMYRPSAETGLNGILVEQLALEPFFMPPDEQREMDGQGLMDEQGGPKTIADLQGKVTFISFWATWCGPCRRELPHLGAIADRFEADPAVQVWTVLLENRTDERTKETVKALFDEAKVTLPVYIPSGPLEPKSLVPEGIPASLLIGPDGKIAGAWAGYHPNLESEVVKLVTKLQEAKKTEIATTL